MKQICGYVASCGCRCRFEPGHAGPHEVPAPPPLEEFARRGARATDTLIGEAGASQARRLVSAVNVARAERQALATTSIETVAHLLGILAGFSRWSPLLIEHLQLVATGETTNPIGLKLSPSEVIDFLRDLEPVMKAAIRLHDLHATREAAPVENTEKR